MPRLLCLLLAVAMSVGGVTSHAGAVLHLAPGHSGGPSAATEDAAAEDAAAQDADADGAAVLAIAATGHAGDVVWAAPDCDGAGHGLGGFCFEAQCCAPAVEMAACGVSRPAFEGGEHVIGDPGTYALSVAYSLLKPPRAIA